MPDVPICVGGWEVELVTVAIELVVVAAELATVAANGILKLG